MSTVPITYRAYYVRQCHGCCDVMQ